jgi:small conductance mechanosensitive channel
LLTLLAAPEVLVAQPNSTQPTENGKANSTQSADGDGANSTQPADGDGANTTQPVDNGIEASFPDNLTSLPPEELKIRLAPLTLDELESVREKVTAALRAHAEILADQLVQRLRLDDAPERDAEAIASIDASLAEMLESKTLLLSRANIVLAGIEAKGGDITAERAYVTAVNALHAEGAAQEAQPAELTPEELAQAAVRGRVSELIAIVRAEPPVHERPKPWDIPVSELELELQPLTLEEIQQRLQAWQEILQREVRKRIRYDILLNNAEKLSAAQDMRAEAALLAGIPEDQIGDISIEDLKAELAAQSQEHQQIIRAIVERMNATIRLVKLRGGDAQKHIDYVSSATGQKLNIYDPTVLYAQVRAWLFSREGGIEIGLNILKFFAVLLAFWVFSLIVGWVTTAGVNRLPRASSLLRPLLVSGLRRTTMFIGLIIAITMLGVNAGPLLAMIGAAGLVIGLALQGTLSNFASGILILINRPFDVGDAINAGGVLGKVEAMNLVSTSVLTFDNQVMLVPNNQIWNGVITNITGRTTRRVDMTFGIGYSDDVGRAMEILEETIKAHPKVLADPVPNIRVNELGDNSVNLIARPWANTSDYWDVYWDLMRDVKIRFDKEGINIPFPQRDVHVPGPIEVRLTGNDSGNGTSRSEAGRPA